MRKWWLFFFLPLIGFSEGLDPSEQLFRDLETVELINRKIHDRLPLIINYQLQGGYFTMPSARTYDTGEVSFSFAYVPPYHIWGLGFQFFNHLETTGNYWIYKGILEQNFGHLGFGDDAERSANVKLILLRKSDGISYVPDLAIGFNDFIGTKRFYSFYAVATAEFLPCHLEATVGWGNGRIRGFFGGVAWSPLRHSKRFWKDLSLIAEYDANDYRHHPFEHPKGRTVKNRINAGVQFKLWDLFRFSASTLRGDDWAASAAFQYPLGSSPGLFPKIYDPPVYHAPVDIQPLGILRTREEFAQELAYAFKEQGFDLYTLYLLPEKGGKDTLWMKIINVRYREEEEVRRRIEHILASLSPLDVSKVTIVIEADGLPVHEYHFRMQELVRYREGQLGENEFQVVAPLSEASSPPSEYDAALLYRRRKPIWALTFRPWIRTFFGSSRGKFKYETGFFFGPEGYLFDQIYYYLNGSYTVFSSTQGLQDRDAVNPSRLINVRTDTIRYNQASSFHLEQAFVQKSWNWGSGWFSRLALGYFEVAYAGLALEALYFPVHFNWAIGVEVATLLKRRYFGFGFQHKVRKLTDDGAIYVPYTGLQYFLDFYYEYKPYNLDFKISAGQFLARDKGIRIEGARTFPSGLRFGLWYTLTNANDRIGGDRYYDKGFFFSLPLDFFLNKTSRTRVGYGMAAWLRDCGARANTGKQLYPTLYWDRYNPRPPLM